MDTVLNIFIDRKFNFKPCNYIFILSCVSFRDLTEDDERDNFNETEFTFFIMSKYVPTVFSQEDEKVYTLLW